jgi:hypothetical protein
MLVLIPEPVRSTADRINALDHVTRVVQRLPVESISARERSDTYEATVIKRTHAR